LLKLGLYRLDQYQEPLPGKWSGVLCSFLRLQFSRTTRVSYQLLRTSIPPSQKEVSLFEWTIRQVRLSSGVYRTTWRGRFRLLDDFLNNLLRSRFESSLPLDIHDWAASDCLASSEWYLSLEPLFPNARVTASDLTLFLVEVRLAGGEAYILEPSGEPLQYIRPPFVTRLNPPEPWCLVVNWLLQCWAQRKLRQLRGTWEAPMERLNSEDREDLEEDGFMFRKVPLVHPEVEAFRRSSKAFEICRHSAFDALPRPCHVIRTMNIFHLGYFPREELSKGARAVWKSLLPGGVWIVGRTTCEDPPEYGVSVLVKERNRFRLLHRYGGASEIEELALGICETNPSGGQLNSQRLNAGVFD
jgi:hypothetical protein